jgi:hypothetical protein
MFVSCWNSIVGKKLLSAGARATRTGMPRTRLAVCVVALTCAIATGTNGAIPCPALSHKCTTHDDCTCAQPLERLVHHHGTHSCYSCGAVQGLQHSPPGYPCASDAGTCTEHQACVCPAADGFRKVSHMQMQVGGAWDTRCYSCTNQPHVNLDRKQVLGPPKGTQMGRDQMRETELAVGGGGRGAPDGDATAEYPPAAVYEHGVVRPFDSCHIDVAIVTICLDVSLHEKELGIGLAAHYRNTTMENHRAYAEFHGYHYRAVTEPLKAVPLEYNDVRWHKTFLVEEALQEHVWVLWTDCDALFLNFAMPLPVPPPDSEHLMVIQS